MSFTEMLTAISMMVLLLGIPILALIRLILRDRQRSEERKLSIEKGLPIPEYPTTKKDKKTEPRANLRSGIIGLSTGVGLILAGLLFLLPSIDKIFFFVVLVALGIIAVFDGLAKFVYYKMSIKKNENEEI